MQVSSAKLSAENSTKWSAQRSAICSAALQTECCLWRIASSPLETGVLKAVPNGVLKGVLKAVPVPTGSINFQIY